MLLRLDLRHRYSYLHLLAYTHLSFYPTTTGVMYNSVKNQDLSLAAADGLAAWLLSLYSFGQPVGVGGLSSSIYTPFVCCPQKGKVRVTTASLSYLASVTFVVYRIAFCAPFFSGLPLSAFTSLF